MLLGAGAGDAGAEGEVGGGGGGHCAGFGGVEQVRGLIEYGEIEQKLGMITGVGDEVGMFVR